jgi:hypothetical protein
MATVGHRGYAHCGVTTTSAIQQRNAAAHFVERYAHVTAVRLGHARYSAVPPLANPFFHQL